MGYGSYSIDAHRALTSARASAPREAIFEQRECHPLMNPKGLRVRESRDSETHPRSLGIVFALDVTGSMGGIPDQLARADLPELMGILTGVGVEDPQVLFMAVGDATCDRAPLQIGQFESEAELMDQWLTWSFLEGGGGGSNQESYELAMYLAARHTSMDCYEKRGRRGYFFMTGDENPYPVVARRQVEGLVGDELDDDVSVERIVDELSVSFEPFFLIPDANRARRCGDRWRALLGDHVIQLAGPDDTCHVAAALVALGEGKLESVGAVADRLRASGLSERRVGGIVTAITPFAETLPLASPSATHRTERLH
ncbi:MAG: VWA domain-containing protein [Sandaracinaceae bacterium]|nr:MAG: VWA domain-containing protein [Sandaracinaceae bacterium]